ncbi:MAG TPA: lanthionine synthetase LanC family protein [Puia sp.]|jgi:serine/threonine protein kinase
MLLIANTTARSNSSLYNDIDIVPLDYSEILNLYGVEYVLNEYYWQVGELIKMQGWILHLSVVRVQMPQLLHMVIPELTKHTVAFKIIRDYQTIGANLDGGLGYANLGKMICIYPDSDQQAQYWAKKMIELTKIFRGPAIPTDRHLGSIVYTRYGSFGPVFTNDQGREFRKFILDKEGKPTPDQCTIPFTFPSWVIWPFQEIVTSKLTKPAKLLNYSYYPLIVLKPDVKGNVIRALYFKKIWQIKACLIKQGRKNMFADNDGRDIQDRLEWQYNLYQELSDTIPMPEVFDYFRQDEDTYLAMEFITGNSIAKWIDIAYQHRSWLELPLPSKLQILGILLRILAIIERLHEKGYVHRDITPENFLIDKKEKIFLIDLELAWSFRSQLPTPPFQLGTPGFMSPEQQSRSSTPNTKQDIFGLGALMLVFFTNLSPKKLDQSSPARLMEQLLFFTGEEIISKLVTNCLHSDPNQRPELAPLRRELKEYYKTIGNALLLDPLVPRSRLLKDDLVTTITAGLRGLCLPMLSDSKHCWVSQLQKKETYIGNEQARLTIYGGWHTGLAGPLWLIPRAKEAGFSIDVCLNIYTNSWKYLRETLFMESNAIMQGLYDGGPGIALAIIEGLNSDLLLPNSDTTKYLLYCFSRSASQPDLSTGWAGEGIALLNCLIWINDVHTQNLLFDCVENLIRSQLPDGSWDLRSGSNKANDILTGLDKGVAGVVWFLLTYIQQQPDKKVEGAARKSLKWLIKKACKKENTYEWSISTKNQLTDKWSSGQGIPGIILVIIKAYEVLKDPIFQQIAECTLEKIRPRPVCWNFSLGHGLAGLGEIYLEAFRVFNKSMWKERADWIAQLLVVCFQKTEKDAGYWLSNTTNSVTADLFPGNCGVLHFLIRYMYPEKFCHPLAPSTKTLLP